MFSIFAYAFQAVAPLLLLSVFGYVMKKVGALPMDVSGKINSFMFRYCLPVSLFLNIYSLSGLGDLPWALILFTAIMVTCMMLLGMLLAPLITHDDRRKGPLIQTFFRSNTAVLGLPLATLLGGEKTVATSSALMVLVIMYNLYAVIALGMYEPTDVKTSMAERIGHILKGIAKNPLIRGIMAGVLALLVRHFIPQNAAGDPVFSIKGSLPIIYSTLQSIGGLASPMMLIILGARFELGQTKDFKKELILGTSARLVIAPAVSFFMLYVVGNRLHLLAAPPDVYQALVGIFATPAAVSSVVMTAEMHGDESLAGQLVVWTTLLCPVTIFITIVVMRSLGLM